MARPTYQNLTVRCPPEAARLIALAAAIEDQSKSAWMLTVLGAKARAVVARYEQRAGKAAA